MSLQIQRRWFNVDEYYRMTDAGILSPDDRVELIEGEVIRMSPIGKFHASCVNRITALFTELVGRRAIVSIQNPVRLNDFSEPQPDITVLTRRDDFYASRLPGPEDVMLIVEIADTSASYDRAVKIPLYAQAGIPEVWLADLPGDFVGVFASPVNGRYQNIREARRGEILTLSSLTEITVIIDDLLG